MVPGPVPAETTTTAEATEADGPHARVPGVSSDPVSRPAAAAEAVVAEEEEAAAAGAKAARYARDHAHAHDPGPGLARASAHVRRP